MKPLVSGLNILWCGFMGFAVAFHAVLWGAIEGSRFAHEFQSESVQNRLFLN